MPTSPIQVDAVPEEYDARKVQRVLESIVRQMEQAAEPSAAATAQPQPTDDDGEWLAWLL